MIATILKIIGFLFGLWKDRGPAPIVVEAEKVGAAEQSAAQAGQAVKVVEAEAQAQANAPRTQAEIVDKLKAGKF